MPDYTVREIRKANSLANWSFIGIIAPLIGWVLAGVASSSLKDLPELDVHRQRRIDSIRAKIRTSVTLSIIVLAVGGAIGGWIGYEAYLASQRAEAQIVEDKRDADWEAQQQKSQTRLRQMMLNECLDNVDSWFQENYKSVTTVYQEQNLLESKNQEVEECKLRYPVY